MAARRSVRIGLVAIVAATAALAACGRKGPVRAPELVVPERIEDLEASSAADGVELAWGRPASYVDGRRLDDLGGFEIERSENGAPFVRIATLPVTDRERFRRHRRFAFHDRRAAAGATLRYRVVSFTVDRYAGAPSNVAEVIHAGRTPDPEEPQRNERGNPP